MNILPAPGRVEARTTVKIKSIDRKPPTHTSLPRLGNHVFLLIGLVFLAQQGIPWQSPKVTDAQMVQALHLQPRTPPPVLDPEQSSVEDAETPPSPAHALAGDGDLTATQSLNATHIADARDEHPAGPILTREDAPDREARTQPARIRRE